jgi:hypothetical protein
MAALPTLSGVEVVRIFGKGLYIEGIVFVIFAIFCENDSSSLLRCCSVLTPISGVV